MLWSSLLPLGRSRAEIRASKKATVCYHGGRWSLLDIFWEPGKLFILSCSYTLCKLGFFYLLSNEAGGQIWYQNWDWILSLSSLYSLLGCFCHSHLFSLPCLWICGLVRDNIVTCGRNCPLCWWNLVHISQARYLWKHLFRRRVDQTSLPISKLV